MPNSLFSGPPVFSLHSAVFSGCAPAPVRPCSQQYTGDGHNNGNAREYRIKTVNVGCTERMLVLSSFLVLSLVTLCSASVMRYRLYLVTVYRKVVQIRRIVRFSERSGCWCVFSWNICNQNGHLGELSDFQRGQVVGVCLVGTSVTKMATSLYRAAISKVMMPYTSHGKTSSTKRNSGKSGRDLHTLQRTVSSSCITTAAKMTAEVAINPEHNIKQQKRWCDDHKTWMYDVWKCEIWSDELSSLFPTSFPVDVWRMPKES
jgi:hypothetical protein